MMPEDILSEQIDEGTLTAYTEWKFPELEVDEVLQGDLLRYLDKEHYKLIRDLDRLVVAASEAVELWKKDKPDLFETGTDYLVRSLELYEPRFRDRIPFNREARDGFLSHHHRVKLPPRGG